MPNENVDFDDIQATAAAKAEEAKEAAEAKLDEVTTKLDSLSTNKKLLLTAGVTVIASVLLSKIVQRVRAVKVDQTFVTVTADDVEEG